MTFKDRIEAAKVDDGDKRSILLMGPSGVGKTRQMRTLVEGLPKHKIDGLNTLFVTTENKEKTLQGLEYERFSVKTYDFPANAQEKSAMIRNKNSDVIELFDYLRNEDHGFDAVYYDSIMRFAWKMFQYLKNSVAAKSGESDTRKAYYQFGTKMQMFLDTIAQLTNSGTAKHPVHFIGTWGVELSTDWQGKRQILPIVDGKMVGPDIPYAFDDAFMLGCDEDLNTGDHSYTLATAGTKEFYAKKSSPITLPPVIKDPNLLEIISVLDGKLDPKVLRK